MTTGRTWKSGCIVLAAAAWLSACQTPVPAPTPELEAARNTVAAARLAPDVPQLAPEELARAERMLQEAERVWREERNAQRTRHLSYLARQQALVTMNAAAAQRAQIPLPPQEAAPLPSVSPSEQLARAPTGAGVMAPGSSALPRPTGADRLQRDLAQVEALRRGTVVARQDALFVAGTATLLDSAQPAIGVLAGVLRQSPDQRIVIDGYAESTAAPADVQLVRQRADTLHRELVRAGAPADRIDMRSVAQDGADDAPPTRVTAPRVEVLFSADSSLVSVTQ